jgi:hypothetical protein
MPEAKEETQVDLAKPGYIMVLNANLGNERQISVTGNLPVDVTTAQINAELDKFGAAINRQQSIAAAPAIEKRVLQMKDMIRNLKQQRQDMASRHETIYAGRKVPDPETQNLHNLNVDITAKEDMLKYEEELLERTRKEAE